MRAVDVDDIDDPRALKEIEKENIDLKEQFIRQIMTLEQYFQVAQIWYAEQNEGFNPFDGTEEEYAALAEQINAGFFSPERPKEDEWADYPAGVN